MNINSSDKPYRECALLMKNALRDVKTDTSTIVQAASHAFSNQSLNEQSSESALSSKTISQKGSEASVLVNDIIRNSSVMENSASTELEEIAEEEGLSDFYHEIEAELESNSMDSDQLLYFCELHIENIKARSGIDNLSRIDDILKISDHEKLNTSTKARIKIEACQALCLTGRPDAISKAFGIAYKISNDESDPSTDYQAHALMTCYETSIDLNPSKEFMSSMIRSALSIRDESLQLKIIGTICQTLARSKDDDTVYLAFDILDFPELNHFLYLQLDAGNQSKLLNDTLIQVISSATQSRDPQKIERAIELLKNRQSDEALQESPKKVDWDYKDYSTYQMCMSHIFEATLDLGQTEREEKIIRLLRLSGYKGNIRELSYEEKIKEFLRLNPYLKIDYSIHLVKEGEIEKAFQTAPETKKSEFFTRICTTALWKKEFKTQEELQATLEKLQAVLKSEEETFIQEAILTGSHILEKDLYFREAILTDCCILLLKSGNTIKVQQGLHLFESLEKEGLTSILTRNGSKQRPLVCAALVRSQDPAKVEKGVMLAQGSNASTQAVCRALGELVVLGDKEEVEKFQAYAHRLFDTNNDPSFISIASMEFYLPLAISDHLGNVESIIKDIESKINIQKSEALKEKIIETICFQLLSTGKDIYIKQAIQFMLTQKDFRLSQRDYDTQYSLVDSTFNALIKNKSFEQASKFLDHLRPIISDNTFFSYFTALKDSHPKTRRFY